MTELFSIPYESEYIHGLVDVPEQHDPESERKALIFLNGDGGYRTGPHDMFVTFARKLAEQGYHCVRFDFRGKGYSGDREYGLQEKLADMNAVAEYVKKRYEIKNVSLLGICIGAKLALFHAKVSEQPIRKLILLSSSALRYDERSANTKVKEVSINAQSYVKKLFRKETWGKFFSGKIDYKSIFRVMFKPFFIRAEKRKPKSSPNSAEALSFPNFDGPTLIIHAEKDPETLTALPQIEKLLTKYNKTYESHIIKGANHSFYSIRWKDEIYAIIEDWLINR